jgi:Glycosyl hydrolase 36 superfamily, catalytic domain/Glycosyltransferase family 36
MRRSRTILVVILTLASAAAATARAPARLSQDDTPAHIDSTYGSGHFGAWFVDTAGLPAFRYTLDETADARAGQAELAGATEAQHQVGNDHIVAAAFNHGYTQLWSQDRLQQWANRWDPADRHYAGGFGWVAVDGKVLSTLFLDRPPGATVEREFGVGWFRKVLHAEDLDVEQVVYAPFGDDPLLLDDVTITNRAATTRSLSWFEYWAVDPYDQTTKVARGVGVPRWDAASMTLAATQSGAQAADTDPLDVFAAVLAGPAGGYETSVATFFGGGSRAAPAAVLADHLGDGLAPASVEGTPSGTLFAFRAPLTLAPGASVTLRYAFGMAHGDRVAELVAKYRAAVDPLAASRAAWAEWVPKADFGAGQEWVARELAWDAYLLRSASVWEELCGLHTITQGGYYQYLTGLNLGTRSWPHYLLPMVYAEPALARELLRYTIGVQREDGNLPYGSGPLCSRVDLGTSADLDFWILLAAVEYGLGGRDTAFFDEPLPFFDTHQAASVWAHVKLAYEHQESLRGPHGGYLAGTNGDWSDFSTMFLQMSESLLVAAQLAYVYPRLAELATRRGDRPFARTLRKRGGELRRMVRKQWTGKGWYARGFKADGTQIGAGAIFGEPQPWAILAGVPSRKKARTLVANHRRFLGGVGAPAVVNGPSKIGSSLSPASNDPDVAERSQPPGGVGDNNANYVGGTWFDVNGWLTWALGEIDGVVPKARAYAWDEYTRNTLANHAAQFPDHWAGTISVDDVCYAYYSSRPEQCGNDLYRGYDGQITEQATWMVMDAVRLAGITPTAAGYRIAPHLPFETFSLRLPQIGVAQRRGELRGYVRPEQAGKVELRVQLPSAPRRLRTWVNGRVVPHRVARGYAVFRLDATAGAAADWAVTWGRRGLR